MPLLAFRRDRSGNPNTILTMLTDRPRGRTPGAHAARACPSLARPPEDA